MVIAADKARFALNQGRARPAYQPKSIRCAHCGAGLTQKDERSELVVCDYCGSHLDVSKDEMAVLGQGTGRDIDFPVKVGDSFRYRGARFEILARLAYAEADDGDTALTREYLLFNPRRGSMWLGEYQGHYSLTEPTHVMAAGDPFDKNRGAVLKTHDGREWVAEDSGTYRLVHVDGALPWIARIGDTIQYAEFVDKAGKGEIYEVQRIENQIEFAMGRQLPLDGVGRAFGRSDLVRETKAAPAADTADRRKWYLRLILLAAGFILLDGVLAIYCGTCGRTLFDTYLSADQLTEGAYTDDFALPGRGQVARFRFSAPLDNAWMSFEAALVREDEMAVHIFNQDLSYYSGYEGGEHWSEGNLSSSIMLKIPDGGRYRFYVTAISAKGDAASASKAVHGLRIEVIQGALEWFGFVLAGLAALGMLIWAFSSYDRWRGAGADDEDDD